MQEKDWLLKEKYHGKKTGSFFADCKRLESGEPLAYVIGYQPFLNTKIYLDSKPLIPRVETEFWVNQLILSYQDRQSPASILDLCAGSGCIGVALGRAFPTAHLAFAEIDKNHQATIEKNYAANDLTPDRYQIFSGHLFDSIPKQNFSLIVANPPYIDQSLGRAALSVTEHEPALALFANEAGFSLLREIIAAAPNFLAARGELWLEHEPEHAKLIKDTAAANFSTTVYTDQYGVDRFSKLVLQ